MGSPKGSRHINMWASLVAQMVKNLPAMKETWVQSLGWKDPLEEGMVTHSSIVAWRIPMDRGAWQAVVHGVAKSWIQLDNKYTQLRYPKFSVAISINYPKCGGLN